MKKKNSGQAAYILNKAKDEINRAAYEFENAGRLKEAEQLMRFIIKLEIWQNKHC